MTDLSRSHSEIHERAHDNDSHQPEIDAETIIELVEAGNELAKVVQGGASKGFLFNPANSTFVPSGGGTALSDAQIRALASTAGQEVTFTAVPTGSGARIAAIK